MRKNKSRNKLKMDSGISKNILGITLSAESAIIILVILTILISFILLKSEKISDSYIMHFYFCSVLSAFIGGFISSKSCTFKGIFSGLISSLVYNFTLTIILLFVCKGKIRPDTGILYALTTGFSVLGGIVGANTKRRK